MDKRITILDQLKGLSIFGIVAMHYLMYIKLPAIVTKIIPIGGAGVHVFIFISAFGLYLSYLNKPLSWPTYFLRRFTKIYIPVVFAVTIIFITANLIPIYKASLYAYLGHILLFKAFDEQIIGSYGSQFWFISTIITFYLIFPILCKIKKSVKANSKFFLISLSTSLLWWVIILILDKGALRSWSSFFLQYLWEFSLGMIAADLYKNQSYKFWDINFSTLLSITTVSALFFALMVFKLGIIGKVLNDIPALFTYLGGAIVLFKLNQTWFNRIFLEIGKLSFPIYLFHYFFIEIIIFYFDKEGIPVQPILLVAGFTITYIFSILFNELLKRFYLKVKI